MNQDDFIPVVGGSNLNANRVRNDLQSLEDRAVDTELEKHIIRLLALHNDKIHVRFRSQDLRKMDDKTKLTLLKDINRLLGIPKLKTLNK